MTASTTRTVDDAEVPDSPDGVVADTAGGEVTITLCPDGPLLLRGPATLLGADGEPLPRPRNVVALCRCGGSAIKPLCDGTHKVNGFRSEDG